MTLSRKVGPFPVWAYVVAAVALTWYAHERSRGAIIPGHHYLVAAFDEPKERAELLRGVVIGLVSGIVSYYLLRGVKA